MDNLQIEWDDNKDALNRKRHDGISFDEASEVFADPCAYSRQDRIENGELRWQTIGETAALRLLMVAHTVSYSDDGAEVIRIISARRADHTERRKYHDHRQENFG